MADQITIYQKPTCSKCREAIAILSENGEIFESINYYETPLSVETLRDLIKKLRIPVQGLLRKNERLSKEAESLNDEELLQFLVENPDLIQRPIVVRGDEAVLGRPPENIKRLLNK